MMKTHLTNLALSLFLFTTLGSAAELTIIHSSDVHGRLSPVHAEGKEQQGGLAKRAHFVEQMRQRESSSRDRFEILFEFLKENCDVTEQTYQF